jgi:membrane associated rhomboid family serine protease
MPYRLRFYLYLLVAGVIAFLAAVWLSPLGFTFNIAFALVAGYFGIIVGTVGAWAQAVVVPRGLRVVFNSG